MTENTTGRTPSKPFEPMMMQFPSVELGDDMYAVIDKNKWIVEETKNVYLIRRKDTIL